LIHQTLDGEVIAVNLDTGTYYSLAGVAAELWGAVERGLAVAEVVDEAADRHRVAREVVEPAVVRFLAELADEELISAPSGSAPLVAPAAVAGADDGFPAPRIERYTDMQELLLLDPIHDVDERGWPNAVEPLQGTDTA
jgi:hypothetical protein